MAAHDYVGSQLRRAQECLDVIPSFIEEAHNAFAIERAYYVCFYAAGALLAKRGLGFSKHSALIAAFGKEFAATKLMDAVHHRTLLDLFEARLDATCRFDAAPTTEEAEQSVARAASFVAAAKAFLETDGDA